MALASSHGVLARNECSWQLVLSLRNQPPSEPSLRFVDEQVVQKLRQAFLSVDFSDAMAHLEKHPTLSIGVAERNKAANILTLTTLLSAADQALYAAKNSTRNCVKVFEPPQAA